MPRDRKAESASTPNTLKASLEKLHSQLATVDISSSSDQQIKRLRAAMRKLGSRLLELDQELDHIGHPEDVFDPADPRYVAKLIAEELLRQKAKPLASVGKFYGSGVYALYYGGDFPAYKLVSGTGIPLYVGKADPKSSDAVSAATQGTVLSTRLDDHAKSIQAAENLSIDDFSCRYLVVKSAWQNTSEHYLIDWFKPVWNKEIKVCQGIGKHGDSAKTRSNKRSLWDTVHPGRTWAWNKGNVANEKTPEQIISDVIEHYEGLRSHFESMGFSLNQ